MVLPDRIYLYSALILFVLFVIGMVGLVSPAWRSGHYGNTEFVDSGLLMRCHHFYGVNFHRCAPFAMGSKVVWFEVSRVFCSVSMVILFASVVGSGYLHLADRKRQDYLTLCATTTFTGVLGLVGAIVYAVKSTEILTNFDGQLSWGWAVYVVVTSLITIISIALIVWMRTRKKKPTFKRVSPIRGY